MNQHYDNAMSNLDRGAAMGNAAVTEPVQITMARLANIQALYTMALAQAVLCLAQEVHAYRTGDES